jgi:hypothetical protein
VAVSPAVSERSATSVLCTLLNQPDPYLSAESGAVPFSTGRSADRRGLFGHSVQIFRFSDAAAISASFPFPRAAVSHFDFWHRREAELEATAAMAERALLPFQNVFAGR